MSDLRGPVQQPTEAELVSSAYSPPFKLLAVICSCGLLAWGVRLALQGSLQQGPVSPQWLLAGACLLLFIAWHILRSKTFVQGNRLEQTWVWKKQVHLESLAYARLVRVPGLDWLIAPRLYTRTFDNKMQTFYGAEKPMIDAFRAIQTATQARVQGLKTPRE